MSCATAAGCCFHAECLINTITFDFKGLKRDRQDVSMTSVQRPFSRMSYSKTGAASVLAVSLFDLSSANVFRKDVVSLVLYFTSPSFDAFSCVTASYESCASTFSVSVFAAFSSFFCRKIRCEVSFNDFHNADCARR